jgi:hypothetical protein
MVVRKRATAWKLRISMPYFVLRKDADRFLPAFDEYKSKKSQPG